MPGYDGTGPKGQGPMTGRGRGFCILKIPRAAGEPLTGFVGKSGRPVHIGPGGTGTALEILRNFVFGAGRPPAERDRGKSPEKNASLTGETGL
jgi:hypothetical protein